MEAGLDTLLVLLQKVIPNVSENPIAVSVSIVLLFVAYGYVRYEMKKAREREIERDRQAAREDNIDVLENETSDSNRDIRDRMRE